MHSEETTILPGPNFRVIAPMRFPRLSIVYVYSVYRRAFFLFLPHPTSPSGRRRLSEFSLGWESEFAKQPDDEYLNHYGAITALYVNAA